MRTTYGTRANDRVRRHQSHEKDQRPPTMLADDEWSVHRGSATDREQAPKCSVGASCCSCSPPFIHSFAVPASPRPLPLHLMDLVASSMISSLPSPPSISAEPTTTTTTPTTTTSPIDVFFPGHEARCFVWDAQSVYTLRTKYRISGHLIGLVPGYRQCTAATAASLPLMLMPEEVSFALENGMQHAMHATTQVCAR